MARWLVRTMVSSHCQTLVTYGPVSVERKPSTRCENNLQKQPFATFAFKFYPRIKFAVPDVKSY